MSAIEVHRDEPAKSSLCIHCTLLRIRLASRPKTDKVIEPHQHAGYAKTRVPLVEIGIKIPCCWMVLTQIFLMISLCQPLQHSVTIWRHRVGRVGSEPRLGEHLYGSITFQRISLDEICSGVCCVAKASILDYPGSTPCPTSCVLTPPVEEQLGCSPPVESSYTGQEVRR